MFTEKKNNFNFYLGFLNYDILCSLDSVTFLSTRCRKQKLTAVEVEYFILKVETGNAYFYLTGEVFLWQRAAEIKQNQQ